MLFYNYLKKKKIRNKRKTERNDFLFAVRYKVLRRTSFGLYSF